MASRTVPAPHAVSAVPTSVSVADAWEHTVKDWEWAMGVNVWGVIHGVRVFTPILLRQGSDGHIVNTASVAGLLSAPLMAMSVPFALAGVMVARDGSAAGSNGTGTPAGDSLGWATAPRARST